jgi:radical SAM superfamily enzyme YgiQ (UPF0313 family)
MIIENADCVFINDFAKEYKSFYVRSAGLYRMATELRNIGYKVQIVECFSSLSEHQQDIFLRTCVGPKTKFVGLNSTYIKNWTLDSTYYTDDILSKLAKKIKSINQQNKLILGGAQSTQPEFNNHFDTVFTGFADNAIVQYIKYLEGKNPFFVFTVSENQKMLVDGDHYHSTFNFTNSSIVYAPEDNIVEKETLPIEVARGCIFKCKFCSFALNGKNKNDYIKNIDTLREEFIRNYNEYGVTHYIYSDDTHNDNPEKLAELAKVVQALPFRLRFGTFLRLDLLRSHPEHYALLRDGGIIGANFGIETLNHDSGKSIGKGLEPKKLLDELHKFNNFFPDVGIGVSFIAGLPYETRDSIESWTNVVADKDFPADLIVLRPLVIIPNPKKLYKSEFELDSARYYTWIYNSEMKRKIWHNGDFDSVWADNFSKDFSDSIRYKQRVGGFHSALLPLYNKTNYSEIPENLYQQFTSKYIHRLFEQQ